jgi:hypothetical protein
VRRPGDVSRIPKQSIGCTVFRRISTDRQLVALSVAVALFRANVTVAGEDSRMVVLVARGGMVVADGCGGVFIWRRDVVRLVPIAIALPSLLILWAFLRRAPGTVARPPSRDSSRFSLTEDWSKGRITG